VNIRKDVRPVKICAAHSRNFADHRLENNGVSAYFSSPVGRYTVALTCCWYRLFGAYCLSCHSGVWCITMTFHV